METGQIDSGFRHQGGQPGDKIQGLEDDMRGAIPTRRLELVTNITIRREQQPLFRDRRPGNIATQPLQLVALIGPRRHTGMHKVRPGTGRESALGRREPGYLAHRVIEWLIAGRQGLQGTNSRRFRRTPCDLLEVPPRCGR